MIKMDITIDNDILAQVINRLSLFASKNTLPQTQHSVKIASTIVRDAWRGYAMGGSLPGVVEKLKNPHGGYARSIKTVQIDPFNYEIVSEAEIAGWLENGTSSFDMKETHTKGPRSRVSAKGYPYLIVPFRWGTPKTVGFRNVMPEIVYAIVKQKKFEATKVTGKTHPEKNFKGEDVERQEYSNTDENNPKPWGDRLSGMEFAGTIEEKTRMNGMSKMKGQGGRAAGYFTFRVISADPDANPDSWIHPGIKARPVTQAVVNKTKETVNDLIEHGLRRDIGL
jgi:hypothetical protein